MRFVCGAKYSEHSNFLQIFGFVKKTGRIFQILKPDE
jgi:hypothetical protein